MGHFHTCCIALSIEENHICTTIIYRSNNSYQSYRTAIMHRMIHPSQVYSRSGQNEVFQSPSQSFPSLCEKKSKICLRHPPIAPRLYMVKTNRGIKFHNSEGHTSVIYDVAKRFFPCFSMPVAPTGSVFSRYAGCRMALRQGVNFHDFRAFRGKKYPWANKTHTRRKAIGIKSVRSLDV